MTTDSRAPLYRWVIEVLLLLALLSQNVIWLAPAPILDPIIRDLRISLGEAGLIISIIALCIAVFSFLGAIVTERLGALRALLLGIWTMALAEIASGCVASFPALLACRIFEGIGFGLMVAPPGTLVMQWFGGGEWPWINMVNALCSYVGLTTVYAITVPIFYALGASWRAVMLVYGLGAAAIALLWTVLGREHHVGAAPLADASVRRNSSLAEAIRMRDVLLMAAGLFGGMWVFQLYAAFLPQFFHVYRGLGLREAANLTAILPLAGIFAAAGGGFGTGLSGLRKPFTWPVAIVGTVGYFGAVAMSSIGAIRLALALVGIGAAGSLASMVTLLMELPEMTPARMGSALAFVWAAGYAGAFVAPFLGGALAGAFGLRTVMLAFLGFQAMPIVCMYLLPETGPGRAPAQVPVAAGSR